MDDKTFEYMNERVKAYNTRARQLKELTDARDQLMKLNKFEMIKAHGSYIYGLTYVDQDALRNAILGVYDEAIDRITKEMEAI